MTVQAVDHYSPEPNVLERRACDYIKRLHGGDARQRSETANAITGTIKRLQRRAVMWSIVAGLVSGTLIGAAEIFVIREVGPANGWQAQLPYWLAFFVFAGIISIIEILFLYWNALRAIAGIAQEAGIRTDDGAEVIFRGLARTGLEFPNPYTRVFGIDPYALMPRWRLVLQNILYKMKVGVSSFLLRLFLRRVLARMLVRGLIPLIAAPLYAIWNAIITWRVLREARIRSFGPLAVDNLLSEIQCEKSEGTNATDDAIFIGSAELMMRACDAHPNYVYLLARLKQRYRSKDDHIDPDWDVHHQFLKRATDGPKAEILDVLTLAAVLGSKIHKLQKKMLSDAMNSAGLKLRQDKLNSIRQSIIDGRLPSRREIAEARE